MGKEKFEYVIKVDGKVVWRGLNPTKAYDEISAKYPKKQGCNSLEDKRENLSLFNMRVEFPYIEEESDVFEIVKRPKIEIEIFSIKKKYLMKF
ncbi:MAG: hypothetical protein DRP10_04015 [Candidatus Aenigmatarchaeota archaeon]|nr:MAG: hypothetical protein DRP10_04015 [Candidatus Aenigmarchaeota archaeon]